MKVISLDEQNIILQLTHQELEILYFNMYNTEYEQLKETYAVLDFTEEEDRALYDYLGSIYSFVAKELQDD